MAPSEPISSSNSSAPPDYPLYPDAVPSGHLQAGRYRLRFAASADDLAAVQRLRFEVFNLELNEGLDSAYALGRDEDEFDATCHHLMVMTRDGKSVVGTYRLMSYPMAEVRNGFYSETEFDFSAMPPGVMRHGIEVGRACVAADHRNGRVLHLLWRGLARYLSWNQKRYVFGCCSVPTLDERIGHQMYVQLAEQGHVHPDICVQPLPALLSPRPAELTRPDAGMKLPPLFQSYIKVGTRVCSPPALDRMFKVTDFFVVLDLDELEDGVRRTFFGRDQWIEQAD